MKDKMNRSSQAAGQTGLKSQAVKYFGGGARSDG